MRKCAFVLVMTASMGLAFAGPTGPTYQVNTGGAYYLPSGAPQHGNLGGGAFSFTAIGGPWQDVYRTSSVTYQITPAFQTFCVETQQNIYLNTNYYASIDDTVYWDGSPRLLSDYNNVRDVYATYFVGGGGGSGMAALAAQATYFGGLTYDQQNWVLQSYIWNELGYGDFWGVSGWSLGGNSVSTIWGQLDSVTSDYADHVLALNVWATADPNTWSQGSPNDLQSQLIYVDHIVPAPAAVLLGAIGLGLVIWLKLRKS